MSRYRKLTPISCVTALALGLAACSSSDKTAAPMPEPEPTPQMVCENAGGQWSDGACTSAGDLAYQTALAAIAAAATPEAAQAAYDAVDLAVLTGTQAEALRMAVVTRTAEIEAEREAERIAMAYDTAMAAIAAAETAEAAQAAYDAVKDDVSASQGDMLQAAVDARIGVLQMEAREANQKMDLMDASGMINVSDLSTQEAVDAARAAIVGLRQALAAAADVSDADKAVYQGVLNDAVDAVDAAQGGIDTATRRTNQMDELSSASTKLQSALAALSGSTPTQAQLNAADTALAALNAAIADGADLTDDEKAPYQREATNAAAPIRTAKAAKDKADEDADAAANAAMAGMAAKLYAGISKPTAAGDIADTATTTGTRFAGYRKGNDAAVAGNIKVEIGNAADVFLTEDKKATITANHGWAGTRYTHTVTASGITKGDTYEAIVFSNVEAPKQGRKFGDASPGSGDNRAYEYQLDSNGALTEANAPGVGNDGNAFVAARVELTDVTRTAGTETFKFSDPNPTEEQKIRIPGSYHGVSGNYYCNPSDDAAGCSASVATDGFTLSNSGDVWTFIPGSAKAQVTSGKDTIYASYGWWIKRGANDGPFNVSTFHDFKFSDPTVDIENLTAGTAKYVGGAAGQYALASSMGGTNDAGSFTARATLDADFETDMITGTIDNFMGADDKPRDWSVELNKTAIETDGDLTGLATDATVWTIGGKAASADGEWIGELREEGKGGVPKVATGTFYTIYGTAGKMVGAFGANVQ